MKNPLVSKVTKEFFISFGADPIIVRAPGRINLIGEHTDYNLGYVLPAAVGQAIYFAIADSGHEDKCSLISLDFKARYDFKISEMAPLPPNSWQNYILGVVAEIQKSGRKVRGFNMVFSGEIPRGSGMSSSAGLECGTCFALNELFGLNIPKVEMVKMAQKAEHNYAKVMCGIMDQFASMMGAQDQALLLDCKTLEYSHFPVKLINHSLVLCNSNVHHSLADSQYNVRRNQCEAGVEILNASFDAVKSLRDATMEQLEAVKGNMPEVVYRRCKYVIQENDRVMTFAKAMSEGRVADAGAVLKVAQEAMKTEYEITCPEIDFMADFANARPEVLGARMMGGGFGGCTINLIEKGKEKAFIAELDAAYKAKFDKNITPVEVVIADGVGLVKS